MPAHATNLYMAMFKYASPQEIYYTDFKNWWSYLYLSLDASDMPEPARSNQYWGGHPATIQAIQAKKAIKNNGTIK